MRSGASDKQVHHTGQSHAALERAEATEVAKCFGTVLECCRSSEQCEAVDTGSGGRLEEGMRGTTTEPVQYVQSRDCLLCFQPVRLHVLLGHENQSE